MAFQTRQGFGQQQPAFQQHHHHHHHQHQQQFVPGQQQFVPHQQHHGAQPSVSFPGMNGPQAPQQQQGFPGQQGFPVVGQQQQFQPHHHHQQHHSAMPRQHHHHHHHHHHSHHQHQMAAPVHVPPQAPVAPVAPGSAPVTNFQGFVGGNGFTQQSFGRGGFGGPAQQQQPAAYEPYTREEVSEDQLFKDHSPGINFDKYESIDVTVTPNDVPPCEVFQAMDFNSLLHDNIRRCNYTKPTPVQKYGIPIVLFGKDLMACAQTGSGKTAAYLLPALHHAMKFNTTPHQGRTAHPSALILAPTRELALQIYDEGRKFTYRTGLRCVVVYGGADSRHQIYELQRGANLIVATPGRLLEMFQRGIVSFSQLKYLVLDEADRMLDMGFEPQIRQLVEGPDSDMPAAGVRQTLMYSATFPREIQQLARSFLSNHVFLQVGRVGSTTDNITQDARWVEEPDKREMLLQILGANVDSLVLVFVEKKREADFLERFLHHNRISATSIHGDRTQREREMALHYFKTGACRILVATDVAARGLDIPNVSLVIQYDLPTNIDDYVHRIGRTGRAGKTGTAISFFNDKNVNIVDDLVVLLEESKQQVPDYLRPLMKRRPVVQARGRGGRGGYFGRGRGFGGGGRGRGAAPGAGGYGGFNAFSGHPHHHPHHVGQSAHGGNHFAPPARF